MTHHQQSQPRVKDSIIPPMLYLPVRVNSGGQQIAEVREMTDGRRALLAFTALDRLADNCGYEQPWALVQTNALGYIKDEHPFDVVAFDPVLAEHFVVGGKLA